VREVGVDLLVERVEPLVAARALRPLARDPSDPGVLRATLEALTALEKAAPKAAALLQGEVASALSRAVESDEVRVRAAARATAAAYGLEGPPLRMAAGATRSLVLADGVSVEVPTGPPTASELGARIARVQTTGGSFTIELSPEKAPYAVANFVRLVRSGWFNGLAWHRVVPGFVVQTGCDRGDGWGGPGWTIPDEVSLSGFGTGAVGMARAEQDSGGSQWFITLSPQPHLDGEYTHFGDVVQGLHRVRRLRQGDRVLQVAIEGVP
jgi:peptidyl-prolyl cis-trans isomerase B (cyclophilin B)